MPRSQPLPEFENHAEQSVAYTTCYMCACRCGIKVTLENDQVRFIQGNPEHPINKGVLCGKGNAGIMKQNSPAKLRNPLLRKADTARGEAEFEEISWDEALALLTARLQKIRSTDPNKLAFFTGRDQMQALTGLWASQFGTQNWAAHGGFCSVNMAAAGLYTTGYSFWEFGDPDWDNTKYFMLWGVAEDHSSNPIKLGIEKLKRRGAKFVAINPVRTGYQAVADEWLAIKPGTDGLFALALVHVLLSRGLVDDEFLIRYTNASQLVIDDPGSSQHGLLYRDQAGQTQVWCQNSQSPCSFDDLDSRPALSFAGTLADGCQVKTVFELMLERYLQDEYSPQAVADVCGIVAGDIQRIALELAEVAFEQSIEINTQWTDWAGRRHDKFIGRPVSMHAMRGVSAHSNGFQSCRAIHLLQALLGSIDCPGGHLAKPPYPKHIVPPIKPAAPAKAGQPLNSAPLGFPTAPEDLLINEDGSPQRIDKAYSWDAPLANHGLMHMVIRNAVNADPYPIDTLMLFMANMAWNSSMNTTETMAMLQATDEHGEYKIPFIVTCDAFHSEMVSFSDLVLPDTTYLERFDTISMLDRPISEPHMACDAIRHPIIKPDRNVRPWQEVLIDLAGRLQLPLFTADDGRPEYQGYEDFIVRFQRVPGIGFLAGWRGEEGGQSLVGEPNTNQWQDYIDNQSFFSKELPESTRYYRHANRDYLQFAQDAGWLASTDQIVIELYSETLQKFRLAGEGVYQGPCPKEPAQKQRLQQYFDPLPFYYAPLDQEADNNYPFYAITQRPMHMYHSWDSQNAWLRQITTHNYLYMNADRAKAMGIADLNWVWLKSENGKVRAQVKHMYGVQKDTVWTWNAIGKRVGTWGLHNDAPEAKKGFLLNHLIGDTLASDKSQSNADPITGQAAWYDLKVSIEPCHDDSDVSFPQYHALNAPQGCETQQSDIAWSSGENVNLPRGRQARR